MIGPATLAKIDAARALVRAGRLPRYEATVCAWCRRPLSRTAFDPHPNGRSGHRSACSHCGRVALAVRRVLAKRAVSVAAVASYKRRATLDDIRAALADDKSVAARMTRPALERGTRYALWYLAQMRQGWELRPGWAAEVKRLDEIVSMIEAAA